MAGFGRVFGNAMKMTSKLNLKREITIAVITAGVVFSFLIWTQRQWDKISDYLIAVVGSVVVLLIILLAVFIRNLARAPLLIEKEDKARLLKNIAVEVRQNIISCMKSFESFFSKGFYIEKIVVRMDERETSKFYELDRDNTDSPDVQKIYMLLGKLRARESENAYPGWIRTYLDQVAELYGELCDRNGLPRLPSHDWNEYQRKIGWAEAYEILNAKCGQTKADEFRELLRAR